MLRQLLHDTDAEVRCAAAWALAVMPDAAEVAIDDLVMALSDADVDVRIAAADALSQLGEQAVAAVPRLLKLVRDQSEAMRSFATKALSLIAPRLPSVQQALRESLSSTAVGDPIFATWGLGLAGEASAPAVPLVITNLKSRDKGLVLLSGWAIGKMGTVQADPVPPLLDALSNHHWSPVELSEIGSELIDIRPDIVDSLHTVLPPTDDEEYEDFRRLFFHHAFHPDNLAKKEWVAEITQHPWYLKLQRARFPHPLTRQEAEERLVAIREAQGKFFNRLLRNPTLGIDPEGYRLLPGFLKRHTQNIAWSIRRSRQRALRRVSGADVLLSATTDSPASRSRDGGRFGGFAAVPRNAVA